MALFCSVIQSRRVCAQDDDEEPSAAESSAADDPTIVKDNESSSVPAGVQDLGKKDRKPILNPVYGEWYFWVAAGLVAAGWVVLSVWPARQKAPGCNSQGYPLGCVGDGR